ncbi:MAG TPA: hypothetical protein VJ761_22980 [Ktedonobacteraceae bacterium]|nr:hypothetical protein [Ktedonobacteraceae bacterium]
MSTYNYDEILSRIQVLPRSEQLRLLEDLAAMIRQEDLLRPRRSVLEFGGIGQGAWDGIDIQEFINQERDSWDNRGREP